MSVTTHWLYKRIHMTPDAQALMDAETQVTWTYNELGQEIEKWQQLFHCHGLQTGDRIALVGANSMDTFAILFACSYDGYLFTPINTRLHQNEVECIIQDAEPSLIIVDQEMMYLLQDKNLPVIIKEELEFQGFSESSIPIQINPEANTVMIYTGGTTGLPKGVLLSNRAIEWNAINTIVSWGLTIDDVTLTYMPLFHTGGLNALAIPILMAGGKVIVGKKFEASRVIRELSEYDVTTALFVPTMYQMMIQTGLLEVTSFPKMKSFLSGGAPCPLSIYHYFEKWQLPFKQGYGLSEAGPNNFRMAVEEAQKFKGSVGKPMVYAHICLLDEKGQEITSPYSPGEIGIRGPHLFSGYWRRPEETNRAFVNRWFKTGDMAMRDEWGNYTIMGRQKEMIISGGENIYPQEIENVLNQLPYIHEQAVIGVPDEKWGEVPVAFITTLEPVDPQVIKDYCAATLSKFKCPATIFIVADLPKTAVGKLDKQQLFERATQAPSLDLTLDV